MFKIGVVGLGKLGCPLAAVFASRGVHVTGHDVDNHKVQAVLQFKAPVEEPGLQALMLSDTVRENLTATGDISILVRESNACVFVTPTPSLPDGSFDHSKLKEAMWKIWEEAAYQKKRGYISIVASTVMPGTLEDMKWRQSTIIADFNVVYKPEFIALGSVIENLMFPDVTLIGSNKKEAGDFAEWLYRIIAPSSHIVRMSIIEAELTKISINCAVTMKISLANQIGMLAEKLGADPVMVLGAIGLDRRINSQCLRYGLPYGGPCFPRDNAMLSFVAEKRGVDVPIARATAAVNRKIVDHIVMKIDPGATVGILGLAYKPGTSITEESAGLAIKTRLEQLGYEVRAHDPHARCPDSLRDVLACDTVVLCCDWPEYRELEFKEETKVIDPFGITKPAKQQAVLCRPDREQIGNALEVQ